MKEFEGISGVPRFSAEEFAGKSSKYCMLIPILNEHGRIEKELERAVLHGVDKLCDIVICDGGSTDGSTDSSLLEKYHVNTLLVKNDVGKQGAQLRMGFWWAVQRGYEGFITIDGNNKDSIEDAYTFVEKLEAGFDFVQGSRFIKGGKAENTPPIRHLAVKLIHAPIISQTARKNYTDTTNAYRAYSRKYILHPEVQIFRDIFMTYELLAYLSVRADQLSLMTCEVPVSRVYPRNEKTPTKISPIKGSFSLLAILFRNLFGKYLPDTDGQEKNRDVSWKTALLSLSYALILASICLPSFGPELTKFRRILGNSIQYGIDIESRIQGLYLWYLVIFPIFWGLLYLLIRISLPLKFTEKSRMAFDFASTVSVFSFIPILFGFASIVDSDRNSIIQFGLMLALCLSIPSLLFSVHTERMRINFDDMKWSQFMAITASLPIIFIGMNNAQYAIGFFAILYCVLLLVIVSSLESLRRKDELNTDNLNRFKSISWVMSFSMALVSLFLESCNVLNQYQIFIYDHKLISFILVGILAIVCIAVYFLTKKSSFHVRDWNTLVQLGLLISFALVYVQIPLQSIVQTDLFESANHGLVVSEFLNYGKIPIIETFDAHMLSQSWGGILFGLVNGDSAGAIFCLYSRYIIVINVVILYLILKEFFDSDSAFLFCLLLPLSLPIRIFDFAMIAILFLLKAIKKDTIRSYLFFWISLVVICLYRLDNGFAYSAATTIFLLAYVIMKRRSSLKKAFLTLAITLIGTFAIFGTICMIRGINIPARIKEFLALCMSNVNWAYSWIGDPSTIEFAISYIFLPLCVITFVIFLLYRIAHKTSNMGTSQILILTSLSAAYLFNISRALVRHSLSEYSINTVFFSSVFFISLAVSTLSAKRRKELFTFSIIPMILLSGMMMDTQNNNPAGIGDRFYSAGTDSGYYDQVSDHKVQRVIPSDAMRNNYMPIVVFINSVLDEDDTYLDFTNQTLLYALSGREKPVYINQSPGLLSGEYTQQQFIQEIESAGNVNYVLMPTSSYILDGLANPYRYYLVSEYISKNYVPLCICKDAPYTLWVKSSHYDAALIRLENEEKRQNYSLDPNTIQTSGDVRMEQTSNDTSHTCTIYSGTDDPHLDAFISDRMIQDMTSNPEYSGQLVLKFDYTTDITGYVQLFYTTEKDESFSREKSIVIIASENTGTMQITVPATEYTRIRFDTISGSTMTVSNVLLGYPGSFYSLTGYNYGTCETLHTYDLGEIPFIWGTYDEREAWKNDCLLTLSGTSNSVYPLDASFVPGENGNYILLTIDAAEDGNCSLFLSSYDPSKADGLQPDPSSVLAEFQFTVRSGQNRYIIRASSDFNWYSNEVHSILISPDIESTIQEADVLEGD